MGLAKELTEREKRVILALRRKKMKLQEIADVVNRHVSSVHRVVKAGITQKAPSKRGSKKKIGERTRRVIIRQAKLGSGGAKKLKAALQLPAGVRTIQRYISQAPGMKFKKIRRGPMLLPRHRSARRIWADEHDGLDDFWWSNVMFSDEKKWNMDGPDGYRHWVDTRATQPVHVRRHTGGGSVMIWGGFCGGKKTTLKFLNGRVNLVVYVQTLEDHLQPSFDAETQIVQQDNASSHTSRFTKSWLQREGIEVLPWPALSPDLNPIENVWGYMTAAVYANGRQFYSEEALKKAIQKVWDEIPDAYLASLVKSMPKRVQLLKEVRGKQLPY